MVISRKFLRKRLNGSLMVELLVGMAIVATILLPTAYSISAERRLMRAMYQHAVAMEIVDGEMEILAAGGWRGLTKGVMEYPVRSNAVTNLPPGRFIVTLTPEKLQLEWRPNVKQHGGPVVREVRLK